jgi:DNA repair protein RecN (Recombination protein N)
MLASLTVRDIVLIERAELGFAPGLNVLTGETGAGKSILLDALGLAAGERGPGRGIVRVGSEQAVVTAVFDLDAAHSAIAMLKGNGLEDPSGEIILRRTVSADGRSRAYINDAPVGIQLARDIGALLVEVHGQTDDRGLFDVATHRVLLDAFGGHIELADETASRFAALTEAQKRRVELQRKQTAAAQEIEYLTHAARELRDLAPQAGEEASLSETRALLMNAGRLAQDIAAATDFVAGDAGAEIRLASALRRLSRLPPEGKQAAAAAETALDSALALVQEARSALENLLARLEADPNKLEQIEERLFAIRAASRKYNVPADALGDLRANFESKLAEIDGGSAAIAAADAEVARVRTLFSESATQLSARRADAAKKLEQAVAKELAPLKLGATRVRVALTPTAQEAGGPNGMERVAFEIATIEGAAFGPLAKIASGGELARLALALKVALAEASPPAVLVFDEVDRGVGGAVAAAVGERLQRLARTTQVLLVTHSPQVAARAARHFQIARKRDVTRVEELSQDERVEEIARMLSGAAVTEEARAAARRLLDEAQFHSAPKKRVRA